tara:strand:+ start:436 stop:615 length:180 start_codon:yes stop_codon:yes gene_type:complete
MDLGSVNAPPPLEHRDSGVGWSGDTAILLQRVMPLAKILKWPTGQVVEDFGSLLNVATA